MNQQETIAQLTDHLQRRHEVMLDLLRRLVEAESPTSVPESQTVVFDILTESLAALGFRVERIPGTHSGGQMVAWPGNNPNPLSAENNQPNQLLLGHCDTVWPLGTLTEMPFRIDNNTILGPGVYDMKGGLVQMVMALDAVQTLGWEPSVMPIVCINSDEETGSRESRPLIGRLARKASRALVLEPSLGVEGRLKTRRKGVGRFQFEITGQAAHAGLDPDKGVSAILELAYLIQKLHALNDAGRGISVNVGVVEGGTRANVIASASRAVVDVRVPSKETAEEVEQAIRELQPELTGTSFELTGGFNRLPLEKTAANEELWQLAKEIGRGLGLELEEGMAGGGSDGNTTSLYTATLDGLGAVGDGAHAAHEFLFVDRMVERSALLALLLMV